MNAISLLAMYVCVYDLSALSYSGFVFHEEITTVSCLTVEVMEHEK